METYQVEEERIREKLKAKGFSNHLIDITFEVFNEVDKELTDEGWIG